MNGLTDGINHLSLNNGDTVANEDFEEDNQIFSRSSIAIEAITQVIVKQADEVYNGMNRVVRPYYQVEEDKEELAKQENEDKLAAKKKDDDEES